MKNNNKSYKKSKNVSHHSMRRGKQRAGLSKTETKKMASRAFADGIDFNWTTGKLYEELSGHYGNIRYYANQIYIFGKRGILVTVLNIDPQYERDLIDYVTYPVFVWYKNNRYKYKNNGKEVAKEINDAKTKVLNDINTNFFNSTIRAVDISAQHRTGTVTVTTCTPDAITDELKAEFKAKYGMSIAIQENKVAAFNNKASSFSVSEANKQILIKTWFNENTPVRVKVNYFDSKNVILRVTSMYTKDQITPAMKEEFERLFKLKAFIREKNDGLTQNVFTPEKIELASSVLDWFVKKELSVYIYDVYDEAVVVYPHDTEIPNDINEEFYKTFNRILVRKCRF